MPRRPAPSALRLHQGPAPIRGQPKHVLPAPPPPTFIPLSSDRIRPSRPKAKLHLTNENMSTYLPSLPPLATLSDRSTSPGSDYDSSPTESRSTWSIMSKLSMGLTRNTSKESLMSTSSQQTKVIPPWDRSRSFSFTRDGGPAPITPPQPALSNPIPAWAL